MIAESAKAMAGEEKNSPMVTRRRTRKNTWGQLWFGSVPCLTHLLHAGAFEDLVTKAGTDPLLALGVVCVHVLEHYHGGARTNLGEGAVLENIFSWCGDKDKIVCFCFLFLI